MINPEQKQELKCEVLSNNQACGNIAEFKVRHKEHPECSSFFVCKKCVSAYNYKSRASSGSSFIVLHIQLKPEKACEHYYDKMKRELKKTKLDYDTWSIAWGMAITHYAGGCTQECHDKRYGKQDEKK